MNSPSIKYTTHVGLHIALPRVITKFDYGREK